MDTYTIGVGNPDPDAYDAGNAFYSLTWNAQRDAWEYRPRYVHGSTLPIRIANADAAARCADEHPECNAGSECALHRYCQSWGPVRGSGGGAPWQRTLSAGRRILGAIRGALGRHGKRADHSQGAA